MSRSTFRVLFYANGSKEKNGIVPLVGRVTINETDIFDWFKQKEKEFLNSLGINPKEKRGMEIYPYVIVY